MVHNTRNSLAILLGLILLFVLAAYAQAGHIAPASDAPDLSTTVDVLQLDAETPIEEDYENQKIEQALCEEGYYRNDIPLSYDLQDVMTRINRQSLVALKAEDVFTFRIAACDDQPDRDNEQFTLACLQGLAKLYVGKTVIMTQAEALASSSQDTNDKLDVWDQAALDTAGGVASIVTVLQAWRDNWNIGQTQGRGRGAYTQDDSNLGDWSVNAFGLNYVPYDNFPALLHQGERVQTAAEARADKGAGRQITIHIDHENSRRKKTNKLIQ